MRSAIPEAKATTTSPSPALERTLEGLLHGAAISVVCLTLVAVAQPLFTEDMWWHLSMGRAYAAAGPWLDADPNLFTAIGPPSPAAWLSSLSLYGLERFAGFQSLRLAHLVLVSLILAFAWSSLFKISASRSYASTATALFAGLSAYRLFQLRPDLVSLLGAVLLVWLLIVPKRGTGDPEHQAEPASAAPVNSRARLTAAVVLMGLWANGHAGFLLGLILIAAAIGGLVVARSTRAMFQAEPPGRMRWLLLALGLGLLATLVNPTGAAPHFLYFSAGAETPDLAVVVDEWTRINLLALPPPNLPPSLQSWIVVWALLLITPLSLSLALAKALRSARTADEATRAQPPGEGVDPALVGVAGVSLIAMLLAVRFLWLGIFPLLLIGACIRASGGFRLRVRFAHLFAGGVFGLFLAYGFFTHGAWPMISKAVRWQTYARPYTAAKNDAHAVWFMRDAGLEGNLYNDYWSGNFLGYWLSPGLRTFVNGSLNVPIDVMDAGFAISRRAWDSDIRFEALLDQYRIDVFFGTGTPRVSLPGRPVISTTTHLEHSPGWVLVFRSLSSAIYLRDNPRNRKNLERVGEYYADVAVPFDLASGGLDVAQVIRSAPEWAARHGLIPGGYSEWVMATRVPDPTRKFAASDRLASLYAMIGLYQRAESIDRGILETHPRAVGARRRLVWSLFHQQRFEDASFAAAQLAKIAPAGDAISKMLVDSAGQLLAMSEIRRAALVAVLPALSRAQAAQIGAEFVEPEVR
jgi:hypothetical protein